mgnify:CR=1 FL=1
MAKKTETKASENKKASTTDINAVSLIGTVLRPNQMEKLCRFTLDCCQVTPKGNIAHSFIPVVWFNSDTEETVSDGERIGVTGYLKSGKYEKDGRTVYTLDVIAEKVTFTE